MPRGAFFVKRTAALALAWLVMGCTIHTRLASATNVEDVGLQVQTRYKYYVVGTSAMSYSIWQRGGDDHVDWERRHEDYMQMQPGVFATGGIPITVLNPHGGLYGDVRDATRESTPFTDVATFLCPFSLGIIPSFQGQTYPFNREIYLFDDVTPAGSFEGYRRTDTAMSIFFSPLPLLCLHFGPQFKDLENSRTITARKIEWSWPDHGDASWRKDFFSKSEAYAIASKLKEMEDEGLMDDNMVLLAKQAWAKHKINTSPSDANGTAVRLDERRSPYRILRCTRVSENGYAFVVELATSNNDVLRTFQSIQDDFRSVLKRGYLKSHIGIQPQELVVDFTGYGVKDGRVEGKAVVVSLQPIACTYDAARRRGLVETQEDSAGYALQILGMENHLQSFRQYSRRDQMIAMLPLGIIPALVCYRGNPSPDDMRNGRSFESQEYVPCVLNTKQNQAAFAYAIAVKLKQLEEAGAVNGQVATRARELFEAEASKGRHPSEAELQRERERMHAFRPVGKGGLTQHDSGHASYRIIRCEREAGRDFAYSFELALPTGGVQCSIVEVQKAFRAVVLDMYTSTFPTADARLLVVDFPEFRQLGDSIEGRAVVLAITPLSLDYDANTRRGRLSVRFHPGQAEEARVWLRRNIQTLALDKNITLVTGQRPPHATYYSLGEQIEGDVMEIKFKTE